jgi:hypothetical protein
MRKISSAHIVIWSSLDGATFRPLRMIILTRSSFDTCCILDEDDGVRALHTGDFRNRGFTGKDLKPTL